MAADDTSGEHGLTDRQEQIVRIVREQGYAPIETLAKRFEVSAQTIRRDIIRLDEHGILQRFHGGVGVADGIVRLGYAEKRTVSADTKERIAAAAAALIPDGSAVFLDVGTTVEAVALALRDKCRLHVFTSSLPAAMRLADRRDFTVFVTGGLVQGADGSLVGDTVRDSLRRFRLDFAVIGLSGFDDDGAVMDFDMQKVAVKQAAMKAARCSIAVADRSKFARHALVRVAPASDFAVLVGDGEPPPHLRDAFEGGGGRIVTA